MRRSVRMLSSGACHLRRATAGICLGQVVDTAMLARCGYGMAICGEHAL
jgi:hypothetical protein